MVGIKGVGMTMLAQYLAGQGYAVSGSDGAEKFMTDEVLSRCRIKVNAGFAAQNVPDDADFYVYSTAYKPESNIELQAIFKARKKVYTLAEMLAQQFNQKYGIAVAGTHGKTTVSAWLSFVLWRADFGPGAMVGAYVPQLDGFSLNGVSDKLVMEADEYQNKIKDYNPRGILLNNIDYDHPDFFPDKESYRRVFVDFVKRLPKNGFVVANFDDEDIRRYVPANTRAEILSYSLDGEADYVAYGWREQGSQEAYRQIFKVKIGADSLGEEDGPQAAELGEFSIRLPGRHNLSNALAVIAASLRLGLSLHELRTYLEEFSGTARRMQELGRWRGAIILDDYAHHPAEIKATLSAVKHKYPDRRLVLVFHPHTFSRTQKLFSDFVAAFQEADELIVLDIYGSAREAAGTVKTQDLVAAVADYNLSQGLAQTVKHLPDMEQAENYLKDNIRPKDLVLLMGAGDVFRIGEKLLAG